MHSCQNNHGKYFTEKKLCICLLVTHCLQIAHLMQQKTKLIVTEAKTVWKGFCKDLRDHAMKIINNEEK